MCLLVPHRFQRLDSGGPAGREVARQERHQREEERHGREAEEEVVGGSLTLVGTGFVAGGQDTGEALAAITSAEKLLYL